MRKLVLLLAATAVFLLGNDEFFDAARKGDAAKVRQLLDQGVDVNAKWRYGQTALLMAAYRGRTDVVKVLLERGAALDVKDTFYEMTPLTAAVFNDKADVVRLLVEKGASGADQALVMAAAQGKAAVVKAVLDKGGVKPATLTRALSQATSAKRSEIVEMLKQAGAKEAQ